VDLLRGQGRQTGLGYLAAFVATALVLLVRRFVLGDIFGPDAPLYLFLFAVVASAWFGGLKAGLLATVLSALAGTYILIVRDGWLITDTGDRLRLIVFLLSGATISWFAESMHRSRERAHRQRESLRITLDSIGDAVIATDAEGRITSMNPVAAALTGWTQAEAVGRPLQEVFHIVNESSRQRATDPVKRALAEGRIVGLANHTLLIAQDGTERPIDDNASPIKDAEGTIQGVVLIFRDITERKRLYQQLQEADRRKDEFLAILAHELRNPLAPIRNALQIMRLAGDNRTAVENASVVMERQLQQMVRLIDDLMDVTRIARNKMKLRLERVELGTVMRNAVEISRPLIEAAGHELTVMLPDDPIYVDADAARLAQVFSNLLNNAAKYTERRGRITLRLEREGNHAIVRVKDTGVGISAEHLPNIFEMFSQIERSLERSQGGLGIGLSLAKRLTEMHGGTIEARSEGPNNGSEFIVRLPAIGDPPTQPQTTAEEEGKPAPQPCRVLIVDDNEDTVTSLSIMLRILGHEVHSARDGLQALETANSFRPDVVLLDIALPKLNGYEVARRIRQESWGKNMKLVALTGWGQEEDKRRSIEAGFDHHLTKPMEPTALEVLLKELCPNST
jgi:PAS domain S-box-containing protein